MHDRLIGLFLFLALIGSLFSGVSPTFGVLDENFPRVFVGVDIAYGDVGDVKQLADDVGSYTNLFVLGCTGVTQNRLKLEEACQYLFDKGLFFIVYQEYPLDYSWFSMNKSDWLDIAKTRWGNQFLGIYYTDEVGGRQLDHVSDWMTVKQAENYLDANTQFNSKVSNAVSWFRDGYSGGNDVSLFTSDYSLYWFDYQAGYDVVLAQFGWNYSRQLNVGLCRGAATIQNKEWGAMITWTYKQPPYIESGPELYNDLLLAYDNGAKYIIVFNSNENYTGSILEQEHYAALKQFWQYSQTNSRKISPVNERTAYVLPKDYAFGFRGPNDKIWGLWEADTLSTPISIDLSDVLRQAGSSLDMIYDDALEISILKDYGSLVYWNHSILLSTIPFVSPANSTDSNDAFPHSENPMKDISTMVFLTVLVALTATLAAAGVFILFKTKK